MPEGKTICGIYRITCLENNKSYIGKSKDIKQRASQHLRKLKSGTHINRYLQHAFSKYGKECFEYKIVELCSLEKLTGREAYWIGIFGTMEKSKGYNMRADLSDHTMTEELKQRISHSQKTYYQNNDHANAKPILTYHFPTNTLTHHKSIAEAAFHIGKPTKDVNKMVYGDYAILDPILTKPQQKSQLFKAYIHYLKLNSNAFSEGHTIYAYNPFTQEHIKFTSLASAAKHLSNNKNKKAYPKSVVEERRLIKGHFLGYTLEEAKAKAYNPNPIRINKKLIYIPDQT